MWEEVKHTVFVSSVPNINGALQCREVRKHILVCSMCVNAGKLLPQVALILHEE